MGCVVSMDGDLWTIDTGHSDYPSVPFGTLSFKCVPDCTTPEFACGSGQCCVELPDGSNECQACSSSSSVPPSSSSSSVPPSCADIAMIEIEWFDLKLRYTNAGGWVCIGNDCSSGFGGSGTGIVTSNYVCDYTIQPDFGSPFQFPAKARLGNNRARDSYIFTLPRCVLVNGITRVVGDFVMEFGSAGGFVSNTSIRFREIRNVDTELIAGQLPSTVEQRSVFTGVNDCDSPPSDYLNSDPKITVTLV